MKPYPAYKKLNLDFLGAIPEHWELAKLKYLSSVSFSSVDKHSFEEEIPVRLCNYVDVYKNDLISSDKPFMQATATQAEVDRFTLRKGDVLITKDSESWEDIAVPAYVMEDIDGVLCGYHLALIRPTAIDPKYLFWVFCSSTLNDQYKVEAHGITRYGLGKDSIENSVIPIPSMPEQQAIANFLDCKTAQIDTLIEKKQRQIDLLQEQRTALINQAVTKGLNPDAPMKDSGIVWLGRIPNHWNVKKLKQLSELQTGLTLGKSYSSKELLSRPYLRVANVQDGYLDLNDIKYIALPPEDVPRYELQTGDVVVTEGGDFDKLGRGHVWEGQIDGCLHQNHIFAIRPHSELLNSYYLSLLMGSQHGKNYFTSAAKQTTNLATTNSTQLKNFPVIVPPLEEQENIIDYVSDRVGRVDKVIENTYRLVEKLQEYRTALICEAVTGKIDVR